jgi:phosphoribosylformylglycinamidine synthase PurS subunit
LTSDSEATVERPRLPSGALGREADAQRLDWGRIHPSLLEKSSPVPTIVVEVMPKAELLDPQGKAVLGALTRLGQSQFTSVRVGKRFELTVEGEVTDAVLAEVKTLADEMLSNSVIEDVVGIHVVSAASAGVSV